MTRRIKFLPVRQDRLAGDRVHEVGGQLGQRPQYKAVFQNVTARHAYRTFVDHIVIVKQQIDIERTCCPFIVTARATSQIM